MPAASGPEPTLAAVDDAKPGLPTPLQGRPRSYTVDDSPQVVARIEGDLARVLATVRAGDPALRSLVLTGGFARGEGATLGGKPQNDYDFVVLRGWRRPKVPYTRMAAELERELGLHIDLAPVAAARMRFLAPSIFWYETALRGRVLWGEDLLARIPIRSPGDLDPAEGLRLLVNRAAGLLLVTARTGTDAATAHAYRIQASKGLLAALDAQLLAVGEFAPSQTERWQRLQVLRDTGRLPPGLVASGPWLDWAFRFKVDPAAAAPRDALQAWQASRAAILAAVPVALRHAGLPDVDAYARHDGLVDRAVYLRRSASLPEARRFAAHPTGQVRAATLRLLEETPDGHVRPEAARSCLRPVARSADEPLRLLDGLRRATLQ